MNVKKLVALVLVAIVLAASLYGYSVYKKIFSNNTSFEQREVYVHIPTNANYLEVQGILSNYLKNMENFTMAAEKSSYSSNVRSGRFLLTKGMNNYEILKSLRLNVPVQLTYNNQETIEHLAGRIAQQIEPDSLSILQAITDNDFLTDNGFTQETALCMFIPNTYEFFWDTSASKFRERMAKEYRKFWNEERLQKAESLNLTPHQVMILASIVHKETVKVDERPRVAGVYLNRLRSGMPLQADPTVIYAIKKHTGDWNTVIKRVRYEHTQFMSPYNTYLVAGLPPGPITMPDISAIDAVLNPEKHDFLYFCASVERFGYHEFAKTLAQHNINAAKYQRWLNKQGY